MSQNKYVISQSLAKHFCEGYTYRENDENRFLYGENDMIIFEKANKIFNGKRSLCDVDLHIPKGEIVGVIGACGAGKTTLVKLACGLLKPDSGKVWTLRKEPIKYKRDITSHIGVFMANAQFFDKNDTVEDCFQNMRRIYQLSYEQFETDYAELSEQLGFSDLKKQQVKDLSLGQKMRVQLGGVLIHRPQLLMLDEPTVALDENAKLAFMNILKQRNSEGMTVLITTHNMEDVSNLSSRIILMNNGEIAYYGNEKNLLQSYYPVDTMTLKFNGNLPDLQDLPVVKYCIDGQNLSISYNTNYITSAEILRGILEQTTISNINIKKSALADIISQITKRSRDGD